MAAQILTNVTILPIYLAVQWQTLTIFLVKYNFIGANSNKFIQLSGSREYLVGVCLCAFQHSNLIKQKKCCNIKRDGSVRVAMNGWEEFTSPVFINCQNLSKICNLSYWTALPLCCACVHMTITTD